MSEARKDLVFSEAERCARAMALLCGGEVTFAPQLESAVELAAFLIRLEALCAELGIRTTLAFVFYPVAVEQPAPARPTEAAEPAPAVH